MSEKATAAFHRSSSGTPVFITVVGVGVATVVTDAAKEALKLLGWEEPGRVPTDAELTGKW